MPDAARRRLVVHLVTCALLARTGWADAATRDVPNVAAAADLQFPLREIAAEFESETGASVKLSFGSSGNLRRQIAEGAPFELFLSADEEYVRALARSGHARDEGVVYAVGRIALAAPSGSTIRLDERLQGIAEALGAGRLTRFAVANPEFAPYGRAARQALAASGLWDAIKPRLVQGDNVAQAAQFVASGNVQAGIISEAQARSAALSSRIGYVLLPERLHAPLRQRMAVLKGASPRAVEFYEYLQKPRARAIFTRYGFAVPVG